jgi:hypothetical protein
VEIIIIPNRTKRVILIIFFIFDLINWQMY